MFDTDAFIDKKFDLTGLGEEERKKRRTAIEITLFTIIAGASYSAIYAILGFWLMPAATISYILVSLVNLYLLYRLKNYIIFRATQLVLVILFPTAAHIFIGGYVISSGVIFSAILSPMGALIFARVEAARRLFYLFVFVLVAAGILDFFLPGSHQLPENVVLTFFVTNFIMISAIIYFTMESFLKKMNDLKEKLAREKEKTEQLLLNILPRETADELIALGKAGAKGFKDVTVIFTDFVNFSKISHDLPPERVVEELDYYFQGFDEIVTKHGLEKIKTIGDAYMCASGIPEPKATHALDAVLMGLAMLDAVDKSNAERDRKGMTEWPIRIGIHTGPVVAGVVGEKKFAYDIWGDTVNLASRMESHGEAGRLNISGTTYAQVMDYIDAVPRGPIKVKGKGELHMYFVLRLKEAYSADAHGRTPNERLLQLRAALLG